MNKTCSSHNYAKSQFGKPAFDKIWAYFFVFYVIIITYIPGSFQPTMNYANINSIVSSPQLLHSLAVSLDFLCKLTSLLLLP